VENISQKQPRYVTQFSKQSILFVPRNRHRF